MLFMGLESNGCRQPSRCTCNNALSMENSRESLPPSLPFLFQRKLGFSSLHTRAIASFLSTFLLIFTRRAKELCFRPTPFPHRSFVNDEVNQRCIESARSRDRFITYLPPFNPFSAPLHTNVRPSTFFRG